MPLQAMMSRALDVWKPLLIVSYLLSSLPPVSTSCYWANSTRAQNDPFSIAPDDTPCFPNQENSPCCGTGWSCLSDGVCYIEQEGNGYYYRGTCTDRTWNSQQCPGWCFAQNSNTSIPLAKCQKATGEDWYCCPGDPDCNCETGKFAVKLGASQPTTVTVIGSTSWPGISSTMSSTSGGSTSSVTTTSQKPNSATESSPNSSLSSSTQSGSALAAATTSPSSSVSPSSSSSNHTSLAAGLGAGIGGAVILAAVSTWYWLAVVRPRRRQKALHEQERIGKEAFYAHQGVGGGQSTGWNTYYGPPKELPPDQSSGYGVRTELYAHTQFPKRDGQLQEFDAGSGRDGRGAVKRAELVG